MRLPAIPTHTRWSPFILLALSWFCLAVPANVIEASETSEPADPEGEETPLSPPPESRDEVSLTIAENTANARSLRELLEGRQLVFFGRIEGDLAAYEIPLIEDDDGGELRRFRLGLAGVQPWFPNISYKFELDLGGGEVDFSSMYLRFDGRRRGMLTIGNQDVTQNLSANTGSLSQLFMEAPLPVTSFSLTKRLSLSYDWTGERATVHAMIFGEDPNSEIGDRGFAARAVYSPYRSENGIWHLGGSFVWENVKDETQLDSRPESHVTDTRLVDTGSYHDVEDRYVYSVELAGASGPFTGRLEMFRTDWHRTGGKKNRFIGAYWEAGYFLTGQAFNYSLGKFLRPRLDGNKWAWELGLRLSWVDLNDRDIQGGEQRNAGIALNVYPRPRIRGQINLLQVDSDKTGGDGPLIQARVQFNW